MDIRERLQIQLRTLATLHNDDRNATGPIGLVLGAAYALLRADELNYRHGDVEDSAYAEELRAVAAALANSSPPETIQGKRIFGSEATDLVGIWNAGFYFNSALHRLAAAAERLGVHPNKGTGSEPEEFRKIRQDNNKVKHLMSDKPDQMARGLLTGRQVSTLDQATQAVEQLVDLCRQKGFLS